MIFSSIVEKNPKIISILNFIDKLMVVKKLLIFDEAQVGNYNLLNYLNHFHSFEV